MTGSRVELPDHVREPYEVFINGVRQHPGIDFNPDGQTLHFVRTLHHEGKLGFWRWFLGAWGVGTYNDHDTIDVRFVDNGRAGVIEGLVPSRDPTVA